MQILNTIPKLAQILILTGANGSGKTRLLEEYSKNKLNELKNAQCKYRNLICLSGTVLDKYPKPNTKYSNYYTYVGRKTNTNMFSEIAPFRQLLHFLLDSNLYTNNRISIAKSMMLDIGLDALFVLKFRYSRNTKDVNFSKIKGPLEIIMNLDLLLNEHYESHLADWHKKLNNGVLLLSDIIFHKKGKKISLSDLSSGERAYTLTILTLAFATTDYSVILYDEPENSLHPKWQSTIISDMWNIISRVSNNSVLIVATHSPMVISGANNYATYICNLDSNPCVWLETKAFGQSSDSILIEQFNLKSPRSISAMIAIQKCLTDATTRKKFPDKFCTSMDELLSMNINFSKDDSLYSLIEYLKKIKVECESRSR